MTNFRELQEGNLISSPFGPKVVKAVSADGVIYIDQGEDLSADEVDPVKLTPEILINSGFRVTDEKDTNSLPTYEKDGLSIKKSSGEKFVVGDDVKTELNFVHQLQNLYSRITSEKLTVFVPDTPV